MHLTFGKEMKRERENKKKTRKIERTNKRVKKIK
jgi:hypothetical protein